jgi:thiosulfate reductase cytochrome b subunit
MEPVHPPAMPARGRPAQPWPIRACHWANVLLLPVMAGSGLQILLAYPSFGEQGRPAAWYPFAGEAPPAALRIGGWLAGGRHWHFAFASLFLLNGLVYGGYLLASGEWRERLFHPRRDAGHALATVRHDLRLGPDPGPHGLYNGAQRLAYTGALLLGVAVALTGLVLWKPVQLHALAALVGGYEGARAIHFLGLAGLLAFTLVHLVQVALHPRTVRDMVTGGRPPVRTSTSAEEQKP